MAFARKYLLLYILGITWSHAQFPRIMLPDSLSSYAEISFLDVSTSSQELYAAFGHCGFRITDPLYGLDIMFNFGVFDFEVPDFYLKFIKGEMHYLLDVFHMRQYVPFVLQENRSIDVYEFQLNNEQKQRLYAYLLAIYRSDSREYIYDYMYRNCATKLRDALLEALPEVELNYAYVSEKKKSFREVIMASLEAYPWLSLGIHTILGQPVDEMLEPAEYLFLPLYLRKSIDQAKIQYPDTTYALVDRRYVLIQSHVQEEPTWITPWRLAWLLLLGVIVFTWIEMRRKTISYVCEIIWLACTGVAGCVIMVVWLGTSHSSVAWNIDLLWAAPTHLLMALALLMRWGRERLIHYFYFYIGILCLLLPVLLTTNQRLSIDLLPFWLIFLFRMSCHLWHRYSAHSSTAG